MISRRPTLPTRILTLKPNHYTQIIDDARIGWPFEVCGVIGGSGTTARIIVSLPNVAVEPKTHYKIDPGAFVSAYREIEQVGDEIIGIYHSHPNGAPIPSAVDLAEATWPEAAYVIVGFSRNILSNDLVPALKAWSIRLQLVTPIQIIIT